MPKEIMVFHYANPWGSPFHHLVHLQSRWCKHPPQTQHFPVAIIRRRRFLPALTPSSLTFLVSGRMREASPFIFFYAVNGFHMASSESCREVIRQHSITGGRSICLFRPRNSSLLAFCELSQEVSMRRMARYHHLARLPAWLTMCLNKEYEKTLMPCGQIYLFAAFLFNMCFSLFNYVQE